LVEDKVFRANFPRRAWTSTCQAASSFVIGAKRLRSPRARFTIASRKRWAREHLSRCRQYRPRCRLVRGLERTSRRLRRARRGHWKELGCAAACRRTSARRRASISSPPTKETLLFGPISGTSTNLRLAAWQKMSARRQDQRPCSWSVRGQCRRDGTRPAASAGSTSASSRPRTRRCPRAPG
jgi:hypothetical protein